MPGGFATVPPARGNLGSEDRFRVSHQKVLAVW
jgi:hypothetical protein